MKHIQNENGLTLIEVLISIAILSIIFVSFMSFFPQMGFMNKQNEDKTQAINTAKEVLIEWQEMPDLKAFLVDPTNDTLDDLPSNKKTEGDYYYFYTTKNNYDVTIKINILPSKESKAAKAHLIMIQLFNKKGTVVSETYGYVLR
ncbi:prepilin-type N-terminal cleavage/methylation domain-containing protein [Neobacillus sp. PS2-9]|uniref:prepilin-type N-terminal cleavage/methylation domain-containing protein n=1 Tax=Neobacillus sp. PS2-9 TaxID=3070676 RepID=UPI0027E14D00|nr:prepilin-type N-terminal cleavage/methylation domain-containing protein [Neobacillus sp. PS2-9]WML59565.1 prepilin-type N-terminal cleavage/methylation domain-containing protein [Neobacillus sp. PS2-9]